mmetsp:Transcript_6827/g.23494  ORF Transcript_6827/g.23494 Transcript_6827/m.23494 type:complete len:266 (-) Transcript_6827:68-865(-)
MTTIAFGRTGMRAVILALAVCSGFAAVATAPAKLCVYEPCATNKDGKWPLPPLPYPYDSLVPHIDNKTMHFHHDIHFAGYTNKTNKALSERGNLPPYLEKLVGNMSLEGMMYVVESEPDSANLTYFVNNGGGYLNHKMYFATMAPPGSPGQREPTGALLDAIDAQFGNFTAFKDEMTSQAKSVFGSGWAFLVVDPENSNGLLVTSRPNQNSPYMDGVIPILGLDVWEHAYYLEYGPNRGDYIDNWWEVLNWTVVEKAYATATTSS